MNWKRPTGTYRAEGEKDPGGQGSGDVRWLKFGIPVLAWLMVNTVPPIRRGEKDFQVQKGPGLGKQIR